ncbi:MAG: leucine-rich repeat domain-containing protein [Firmicutes bacterium]|nr:leucine-rich repeat domain-containing protein [Bacillota bacterium]
MKRVCLVAGIAAVIVVAGLLGFVNKGNENMSIHAVAVDNVAYLPEHFTWNTDAMNVHIWPYSANTVITGLAPSHLNLPNLHLDLPSEGPTGLPVGAVANNAFSMRANVVMLTIPHTIETLGNNSFRNNGLTDIIIPSTVRRLVSSTFQNTTAVNLSFDPGSMDMWNASVFSGTPLETITIVPSEHYRVENNSLLRNSDNFLVLGSRNLHIPSSAVGVGMSAFSSRGLSGEIVIPSNIRFIEDSAFFVLSGGPVTTIRIQSNLETPITSGTFGPLIREIIFEEGVTSIPTMQNLVQNSQTRFQRVVIPSTVTTMPILRMAIIFGMHMTVESWMDMGGTIIYENGYEYVDIWGERGRAFEQPSTPFEHNPNLTIYTPHASRPEGWPEGFNSDGSGGYVPVVWGYPFITSSTTGQGTISVADDLPMYAITLGDTRTLTAIPADGWQFVEWQINQD